MTDDTKKPSRKRKLQGPLPDEWIDELLSELKNKDAQSVLGESGLAGRLKKQLAERMLGAELSHHLDREAAAAHELQVTPGNHRNGTSAKTVITPSGALAPSIPRDRQRSMPPLMLLGPCTAVGGASICILDPDLARRPTCAAARSGRQSNQRRQTYPRCRGAPEDTMN